MIDKNASNDVKLGIIACGEGEKSTFLRFLIHAVHICYLSYLIHNLCQEKNASYKLALFQAMTSLIPNCDCHYSSLMFLLIKLIVVRTKNSQIWKYIGKVKAGKNLVKLQSSNQIIDKI